MKHIFIVETADDKLLSPRSIQLLTDKLQNLVELQVTAPFTKPDDGVAWAVSTCNNTSAIRAIYRLYHADQSKSPDELGSAL